MQKVVVWQGPEVKAISAEILLQSLIETFLSKLSECQTIYERISYI
jgi:hypothetical protein